jgi:small subunit ribosomal protein S20
MAKEKSKDAKKDAKKVKRPSAKKRDLQNEKNRLRNKSYKSEVRRAVRSFDENVKKGDAESISKSLDEVFSLMDKGIKHGVYKSNTANRTKSRLAARAHAKK